MPRCRGCGHGGGSSCGRALNHAFSCYTGHGGCLCKIMHCKRCSMQATPAVGCSEEKWSKLGVKRRGIQRGGAWAASTGTKQGKCWEVKTGGAHVFPGHAFRMAVLTLLLPRAAAAQSPCPSAAPGCPIAAAAPTASARPWGSCAACGSAGGWRGAPASEVPECEPPM